MHPRTARPPAELSISISGGEETYEDSPSNGERTGIGPALESGCHASSSNCSLEKRPQRRTGPKSPGKGRRGGRETDSEQVPRGKDEKDFEKRVKECLKLSGGKRMGAGGASRPEAEWLCPVRLLGSRRGSLQAFPTAGARAIDARGGTVGAVGHNTARAELASLPGLSRAHCNGPRAPHSTRLEHGPRSLTCVRADGC
ncbi:hypothetical protein IEQ34_026097 [Dendrobium chrysotoxum]|uniref:Uncharacterized protein n=1 Tax=Dendrobium chrysotoxum TaxID=161865 RepID=A0AAV7FMG5_DENCH|nr:hypothetical protein IEQ34_026097 [Dendrobium chrysotoxum]